MNKLVRLGFCRRPHGLKGGLLCSLVSGEETVLRKGMKVRIVPAGGSDGQSKLLPEGREYRIRELHLAPKTILYLDGVIQRDEAEALLPFEIFLLRKNFPELEEGEFYLADLLGLAVVDFYTKEKIGVVEELADNTVQTILKVRGKVNRDLPLVEAFFPTIDWEGGFVEMIVPEIVDP